MIKLSTLHKWIISFFVLLMIGVPRLFSFEIIGNYFQLFIIVAYSIFFSILILKNKNPELHSEVKFLNQYFLFYLPIIILMTYVSSQKYGYSSDIIIKNILIHYFVPIASYGIVRIFHERNSTVPYLSLTSKFVITMLLVKLFTWGLYNFFGISIFPRLLFQYDEWFRDGFQRIEAGMLFGVVLSYVTVRSMNKNIIGLTHKFLLIFMVLFLILVTRVRFQTTLALCCIAISYIFRGAKTRNSLLMKIFLLTLSVFFIFYNYKYVELFLSLISIQGQYGASTAIRFEGINHYLSLMSQQNAYFGLGVLVRGNFIVDTIMARNQWSIYYLDDLGLLGTVIQFGLSVIVTHGFLFIKAVQVLLKSRKLVDKSYFVFLLCLTTYLIGSNFLLNMFDSQRIFDVAFYLAIYSFLDSQITQLLKSKATESKGILKLHV